LSTWDKVSLYALDRLSTYAELFSIRAIKESVAEVLPRGIANVSRNPEAASIVSTCLRKLAVLGIVTKGHIYEGCGRHERQLIAYKLSTSRTSVAELLTAIDDELLNNGNFNSSFWRTNNCYSVLYSAWQLEQLQEQEPLNYTDIINNIHSYNCELNNTIIHNVDIAQIRFNNEHVSSLVTVALSVENNPTDNLNTVYARRQQQALKELELSQPEA